MAQPPPFASNDILLVRRNPWGLALGLSPLLLWAALGTASGFAPDVVLPALGVLGIIPLLVWARNPWPLSHRVAVSADMQGLEIGARKIPRARIRDGFIVPRRPYRLVLRGRFGLPIELQLGTADEGRALLVALGLDATQTVATFDGRLFMGLAVSALSMAPICAMYYGPVRSARGDGLLLFSMVALALSLVVQFLTLGRLAVGADGVVLSRLGRKRFISYGDIDAVRYEERGWGWRSGMWLRLRSGEKVRLPIAQQDRETCAIIEERIGEAMEVYLGGDGAEAGRLRMGTRTVSQWIASLRAIGAGANADMRTAPFPRAAAPHRRGSDIPGGRSGRSGGRGWREPGRCGSRPAARRGRCGRGAAAAGGHRGCGWR